jgi:hypothetical protein
MMEVFPRDISGSDRLLLIMLRNYLESRLTFGNPLATPRWVGPCQQPGSKQYIPMFRKISALNQVVDNDLPWILV